MTSITVRRNKDGNPNKRDMKQLEQFFSLENLWMGEKNLEPIYAVEDTAKVLGKPGYYKTLGYTFNIGREYASGGTDYYLGEIHIIDKENVKIEKNNEYHNLDWLLKQAQSIIEKEFK